MKSLTSHSLIVDSVSGEFVDIKNGLKYSTGISKLIGLNENEIKIYWKFSGIIRLLSGP